MIEKAQIVVLKEDGETPDTKIPVMFNPENYTVSATGQLSTDDKSNIQFDRVNLDDFTVTLFFDSYEQQTDVRTKTKPIADLVKPTVEGKTTKKPPICRFMWGKFSYKGLIYKVQQEFIMFLPSGIPVRAKLTLTFKAVLTKTEDAELQGKEACWKVWTVKAGDRIDLIAYEALKDITQWKKLAESNNIADPLIFPTKTDIGTTLIIPELN